MSSGPGAGPTGTGRGAGFCSRCCGWPYSLPILLLATLDRVISFLYRGRDVTWVQTAYLVPSFVLLLAVLAATCGVLLTVRLWRLTRPGPAPAELD